MRDLLQSSGAALRMPPVISQCMQLVMPAMYVCWLLAPLADVASNPCNQSHFITC